MDKIQTNPYPLNETKTKLKRWDKSVLKITFKILHNIIIPRRWASASVYGRSNCLTQLFAYFRAKKISIFYIYIYIYFTIGCFIYWENFSLTVYLASACYHLCKRLKRVIRRYSYVQSTKCKWIKVPCQIGAENGAKKIGRWHHRYLGRCAVKFLMSSTNS